MDEFFQDEFFRPSPRSILWFEEAIVANQSSAFVGYASQPIAGLPRDHQNVLKRMMEFWKKRARHVAPIQIDPEEERSHRHRMNERVRRQKHRESYMALHELLPVGTKTDKKSILEMAAKETVELRRCKDELKKKETEMILAARKNERALDMAEIELKVANPASGVDSMLEVLRCLKDTASTARAMRSSFSDSEFAAVLEIEAKIRAADVKKVVQSTLLEAERKFGDQLYRKEEERGTGSH